jgi:hypothetical protein
VSRNRPQSLCEQDPQPGVAASKQVATNLFAKCPADVRRDLDRAIRSALARGRGPRSLGKALELARRYGIRVGAIRRYAKQLRAAGALPADGSEDRALCTHAPLTAMPYPTQRLTGHAFADDATVPPAPAPGDTLSRRFLDRLTRTLDDTGLTPDELARLASSFAHQRTAFVRSQVQQAAARRQAWQIKQERRKLKPRKEDSEATIRERIRRIYGITMPDCINHKRRTVSPASLASLTNEGDPMPP